MIRATVSWLVQASVDFLIEDRCVLCGELSGPGSRAGGSFGRFTKYLTGEVSQSLFGFMKIKNHPVCRACADDFDETQVTGFIEIDTAAGGAGRIPVIAPFMTNDAILKLVHLLKFSAYTAMIPPLARAMREAFDCYSVLDPDSCLLIPVPMHPKRRRERGFNQAELIARALSEDLAVPFRVDLLRRERLGRRQSSTPKEKRTANVQGAFSSAKGLLGGNHAVLVDDLVTTGATAAACSNALLAAGAGAVTVLSLGRSL